tara:strand:- start:3283 stop:4461 length:1179 start_codon:yes stop_codon:yes gene_type:complete
MAFKRLRELRDRFEQQWINGGFIFGYENEINENHNNDYPLLLVLPPTSELPATEGDSKEDYTFECLIVKPYHQNQTGSLDVVLSLLEQEALTWLQRVLDSYTNKEVILSPNSISVEREKELYNDKLIQVRLTFTLNAFSHHFSHYDESSITALSPNVWLRSDLGVKTQMFGGNEVVTRWKDQSGNSNDFIQATSTKQASYEYEDTTNGYPYLNFDGTDDFMQCVNNSIDGTSDSLDRAISMFYIAKTNAATTGSLISLNASNAAFPQIDINARVNDGESNWNNYLNDSQDDVSSHIYPTDVLNTTGVYGFALKSTGAMQSYYNGALVDTQNNASFDPQPYTNTYPIMLGAARSTSPTDFLNAQIQEILIFDKELSTDEALHLSKYLQHKYNI